MTIDKIIICPDSGKPLTKIDQDALITDDGLKYPILKNNTYCLLPQQQISEEIWSKRDEAFQRKGSGHSWAYNHWHDLGLKDLIGPSQKSNLLLNFGSGDAKEKKELEGMGYKVIALDIDPMDGVDIVADGHKLPFADRSFDTIISFEVLEHVEYPWVVIKEINRVLKPGGRFIGSVAFLKPYHYSYFHMSHYGVTSLLEFGRFEIKQIYGGQNFLSTLFRLVYPVGPNQFSMNFYDSVFKITVSIRSFLWRLKTKLNPNQKLNRFDTKYAFSYKEWEYIRNAGCIIFSAVKKA